MAQQIEALLAQVYRTLDGDPAAARDLAQQAVDLATRAGVRIDLGPVWETFAVVAARTGDHALAQEALGHAFSFYEQSDDVLGAARAGGIHRFLRDAAGYSSDSAALAAEIAFVSQLVDERTRAKNDAPRTQELIAMRTELDLRRAQPLADSGELPSTEMLRRTLELDAGSFALVLAAAAPALDARVAKKLRAAEGDLLARAPTAGFLLELVAPSLPEPVGIEAFYEDAPLRFWDTLTLDVHPDRPRGGMVHHFVDVDAHVVRFLQGERRLSNATAQVASFALPLVDPIPLAPSLRERWDALCTSVSSTVQRVILSGPPGAGKKSLAALIARAASRALIVAKVRPGTDAFVAPRLSRALRRDARLCGAWVALDLGDGAPEGPEGARLVDALKSLLDQIPDSAFVITRDLEEAYRIVEQDAIELRTPPLLLDDQVAYFQRAIAMHGAVSPSVEILRGAACQAGLTPGAIDAATARAVARARLRDPRAPHPTPDELRDAARVQFSTLLAGIAQRIVSPFRWEDLVLPPEVSSRLSELLSHVQHQAQVFDTWGFGRKLPYGKGMTSLFAGPPGTGKTMAASVIAAELGLDLFRIDLSQIVSKYIGETEKNLGRVFDRATEGHAVLLFDEADSLFAKRTDVKSSTDRYANLEVNYLLQRLEGFEGIAILTTNFIKNIDEAFRRRLRFIVEFPFPRPEEREQLWRLTLPQAASVRGEIPWKTLSEFELAGGNVKNAVMRAAFAAAARQDSILPFDLITAAGVEIEAMGRLPMNLTSKLAGLEVPSESPVAPLPPSAARETISASPSKKKPDEPTQDQRDRDDIALEAALGKTRKINPNFPFPKR